MAEFRGFRELQDRNWRGGVDEKSGVCELIQREQGWPREISKMIVCATLN